MIFKSFFPSATIVNALPIRMSRHSPYKALSNRRLREQSRVNMMKLVRDTLKPLLGIKQDKEISEKTKNGQHMASPDEVDNFDNGSIPAPSLTNFCPYWDDIYCSWKESLAEKFIDQILDTNPELANEREDMKKHFFQRLETLKREPKRHTPRFNETEAQMTQRTERQDSITLARTCVQDRQLTLFRSRETICREKLGGCDWDIWKALLELVLTLRTEGQSSNESSDEGQDRFTVRHRPWRSEHVTELLQFIDSHRETLNNYGNSLPGKPFRTQVRKSNPPRTQDRPISGLPRNVYSLDFLSTRRSDLLNHLDVQDPI
ncbi:hypothetical protein H2248_005528 [Termitomyces sp. 'cryptogamus']|nr:hypothetical protein H2248_005528 [Termitomyces sp. 'cryptogamus']